MDPAPRRCKQKRPTPSPKVNPKVTSCKGSAGKKRRKGEQGNGECHRSENWSTKETYDFIELWGSYFNRLVGCSQKQVLYVEMAQRMMAKGYNRTALQCRKKMQTLKDYYRKYRKQGLDGDLNWQFYSSIKNLLDKGVCEDQQEENVDKVDVHNVKVKLEVAHHSRNEDENGTGDERSGEVPMSVVMTSWGMEEERQSQVPEEQLDDGNNSFTESFPDQENEETCYYYPTRWDYKRAKMDSMEIKMFEMQATMTQLVQEIHELRKERARDAYLFLEAQRETTRGIRHMVDVVNEWLKYTVHGGTAAPPTGSTCRTPPQFLIPVYQLPKVQPMTKMLPGAMILQPETFSPSPPKSPDEPWTVCGVGPSEPQVIFHEG